MSVRPSVCLEPDVRRVADHVRVGGGVLFSLDGHGRRQWRADPILAAAGTSIGEARGAVFGGGGQQKAPFRAQNCVFVLCRLPS